jgi:hypothetical protein
MPSYVEVVAWLVFASFAAATVGYVGLLTWVVVRDLRSGQLFRFQRPVVGALAIPTAGSLMIRTDPFKIGLVWTGLLVLVPLLVLALWAVGVEMSSRRIGFGLVFAIVHAFLMWQLVRVGTHVQRSVVLSRSGVVVHPVFGSSREVTWSAIERVDDVTYAGPAVSGLYMYASDGSQVVLDRWLSDWESLRVTVRGLTPFARWTTERRAVIG